MNDVYTISNILLIYIQQTIYLDIYETVFKGELAMVVKSTWFNSNCIEMILRHPLTEIGTISLFSLKLDNGDILFSIPHHHWSLLKSDLNKSQLSWPSSFQYSPYKEELIAIMKIAEEKLHTQFQPVEKKAQ
jgi:hypothetical protein